MEDISRVLCPCSQSVNAPGAVHILTIFCDMNNEQRTMITNKDIFELKMFNYRNASILGSSMIRMNLNVDTVSCLDRY
jgi:hypothetical protein